MMPDIVPDYTAVKKDGMYGINGHSTTFAMANTTTLAKIEAGIYKNKGWLKNSPKRDFLCPSLNIAAKNVPMTRGRRLHDAKATTPRNIFFRNVTGSAIANTNEAGSNWDKANKDATYGKASSEGNARMRI